MAVRPWRGLVLGALIGASALGVQSRWRAAAQQRERLQARLTQRAEADRAPAGVPAPEMAELGCTLALLLAASGAQRAGGASPAPAPAASPAPSAVATTADVPTVLDPERELRRLSDELERAPAGAFEQRSQAIWSLHQVPEVDRARVFELALGELQAPVAADAAESEQNYNHTVVALRVAMERSGSLDQAAEALRLAVARVGEGERRQRILKYFEMHAAHPGALQAARQVARGLAAAER
jgi:hypothetical protein